MLKYCNNLINIESDVSLPSLIVTVLWSSFYYHDKQLHSCNYNDTLIILYSYGSSSPLQL